jgi:hypothetical protein
MAVFKRFVAAGLIKTFYPDRVCAWAEFFEEVDMKLNKSS